MTYQEFKTAVLDYMNQKPGSMPYWKTIGVDYCEGKPMIDRMYEEGLLIEGYKLSKTGRKMSTSFTKDTIHLSGTDCK